MYHNDPAPAPGLVEAAFDFLEGDLEEVVDRVEEEGEGVCGPGPKPPGQRHTEDFLEECFAAPVRQNPFLCK